MGTERRLKKLVKEQSSNMGHDIGCWHKKPDGLWVSKCLHCGLMAAIFVDNNVDPKMVHSTNYSMTANGAPAGPVNPSRITWLSGASWDEVHPERSKGTISGMILSVKCGHAVRTQLARIGNSYLWNKPNP